MLLDERADVLDRAGGLRAAQQEQVVPVAGEPIERRPEARVVCEVRADPAVGHARAQDLLADIGDLDRACLVGKVRQR
jgi:hypothetical protein